MVKIGQPILPVDFKSPIHPLLPVEVVDRKQLLQRGVLDHLQLAQRPSFDYFMVMRSGHGIHTVDFVEIPAKRGRCVRARAGQSHAWDVEAGLEATIILSAPGTSTPQPWFPGDPSFTDLNADALTTAHALIDALARDQQSFDGDRATIRLMVSLFDALAALFDQSAENVRPADTSAVYLAFRTALERDISHQRDVAYYANEIGYSERTLTRACLRATGQTAKQAVIARLVLEARRLLTQTDHTIAQISMQLGFSEPTNFTKFFVRHGGTTPSTFRRTQTAQSWR